MRRALVVAAVTAVLAVSGCSGDSGSDGATSIDVDSPKLQAMKVDAGIETCVPGPGGGGLPDLTLPCLGGGPDINLASLRGPMLLNLWYSGCGPCRDEMPELQKFYDAHGDQVPVLGIDVENYPEAAISFAGMVGATYPQVADPQGQIFEQSDLRLVSGYPQTILIDADGQVVAQQAAEFDSTKEIEDFVDAQVSLR